jgi:hypothetical protein
MLNYAELRIQRDLDFLATQNANSSYSLTSGNNSLTIPTSTFVTLQTIYVTDANGNVTPLLPVTKEFLRNVYGSSSGASTPLYFAVYGGDVATGGQASQNIIFGKSIKQNGPLLGIPDHAQQSSVLPSSSVC